MSHSPTVLLCISDDALCRLCALEVAALSHTSGRIGPGDTVKSPTSARLLLIDLDETASPPPALRGIPFIGFTRGTVSSDDPACIAVLYRPFPIEALRTRLSSSLAPRETAEEANTMARPRRYRLARKREKPSAPPFTFDGRSLFLAGREIPLTPGEATLLSALLEEKGQTVDRDRLAHLLGKPEGASNLVDVHICALRKKLADTPLGLQTVRGKGYALLLLSPSQS